MTTSRESQVDLSATPYYHCISRCVRRAFLCGYDRYARKDFDHRKGWLVERLKLLTAVFAVDLCAYAVMSNHFHLVVRVDRERALSWSEDEVLERYSKLFRNAKAQLEPLTGEARAARVELYRARLYDLSWFMRSLNEHIARRANREDGCKGRFWEGRFKSQPLLDETAVLTCMSYVDLNPVRAGVCRGLEDAEFTSIHERLLEAGAMLDEAESSPRIIEAADASAETRAAASRGSSREAADASAETRAAASRGASSEKAADVSAEAPAHDDSGEMADVAPAALVPFHGAPARHAGDEALPMSFADYVELLDWTGRASRPGKSGRVRGAPPSLLVRRGIDPEAWLRTMRGSGLQYLGTLGSPDELDALAEQRGTRWVRGKGWARGLYAAPA